MCRNSYRKPFKDEAAIASALNVGSALKAVTSFDVSRSPVGFNTSGHTSIAYADFMNWYMSERVKGN